MFLPSNAFLDKNGNPLSSENKSEWLQARANGVTATDINKLISPTLKISSQSKKLLQTKIQSLQHAIEPQINSYMAHGNEREPIIAEWASGNFGMKANNYLFYGKNKQHLATPDGLGEDFVGEIKTSIKPLKEIVNYYMNQIQWQLHVMDVSRCLFLVEQHENFKPINIDYIWIEKDIKRIEIIEKHANIFIAQLNAELNK